MSPSDTPGEKEPPAGGFPPPPPSTATGPDAPPTRPGGPPVVAAAKAPLPPPDPALQHRATAALFVAVLSLAGFLGFNVQVHRGILIIVYALLAGATALWLAVTAMRRARRSNTARPRGSVTATAIAGVGIGLAVAMLVAFGLFGRQLSGYGQCLSGANTLSAQQSCYRQFSHALNQEISVLSGLSTHG